MTNYKWQITNDKLQIQKRLLTEKYKTRMGKVGNAQFRQWKNENQTIILKINYLFLKANALIWKSIHNDNKHNTHTFSALVCLVTRWPEDGMWLSAVSTWKSSSNFCLIWEKGSENTVGEVAKRVALFSRFCFRLKHNY